MSEHEKIAESDEWYTPRIVFESLGIQFDLDPCSPSKDHWTPATTHMTKEDDGLSSEWFGKVWMNPPFGGRNGQNVWLEKFINHGNGIGLVAARTSAAWFHEYIPSMSGILFPKGKTKFIRPDGTEGKSPGTGVVLFAIGSECTEALRKSKLGIYLEIS